MESPTLPGVYGLLKAASLLPAKGAVNTPEAISLLLHVLCIWGCCCTGPPPPTPGTGWARGCWHGSESPQARALGRGGVRGGKTMSFPTGSVPPWACEGPGLAPHPPAAQRAEVRRGQSLGGLELPITCDLGNVTKKGWSQGVPWLPGRFAHLYGEGAAKAPCVRARTACLTPE